jgi:hypothetical protein
VADAEALRSLRSREQATLDEETGVVNVEYGVENHEAWRAVEVDCVICAAF